MSALAAAYAQTFRPVGPQPGLQLDRGATQLLGGLPLRTAQLMAPLAQQGLAVEGNLLGTKQRIQGEKDLQAAAYAQEDKRVKTARKRTLADRLFQVASGVGRSGSGDWATGQLFASQGDALTRTANRYGTALSTFEGANSVNAPSLQAYLEAMQQSGAAGAGLLPSTR